MYELVFDSKLSEEGMLYCPKEFLFKNAEYKVIVKINENETLEAENSAISDNSFDFLTEEEVKYYINLD